MITYNVIENAHDILMGVYSYSTEEKALECVKMLLKKYKINHLEPSNHIKTAVVEFTVVATLVDAH